MFLSAQTPPVLRPLLPALPPADGSVRRSRCSAWAQDSGAQRCGTHSQWDALGTRTIFRASSAALQHTPRPPRGHRSHLRVECGLDRGGWVNVGPISRSLGDWTWDGLVDARDSKWRRIVRRKEKDEPRPACRECAPLPAPCRLRREPMWLSIHAARRRGQFYRCGFLLRCLRPEAGTWIVFPVENHLRIQDRDGPFQRRWPLGPESRTSACACSSR